MRLAKAKRYAGWTVCEIAKRKKRTYITPEDVAGALKKHGLTKVRADVLAVIGKQTRYGCEDASLCAFVAWDG